MVKKTNNKKTLRKNLRALPQRGKIKDIFLDQSIIALLPGKRVSATGNIYWETRANRSDLNPSKGL